MNRLPCDRGRGGRRACGRWTPSCAASPSCRRRWPCRRSSGPAGGQRHRLHRRHDTELAGYRGGREGPHGRAAWPTVCHSRNQENDKHPLAKYKLPMPWGLYVPATKKFMVSATIKPEDVAGRGTTGTVSARTPSLRPRTCTSSGAGSSSLILTVCWLPVRRRGIHDLGQHQVHGAGLPARQGRRAQRHLGGRVILERPQKL